MPFRRFFERGAKQRPASDVADELAAEDQPDESTADEADLSSSEDDLPNWRQRAAAVLPTGASTGSKRPAALYGSDDAEGPTHFTQSVGCRVVDADGNRYIDCTMALGSVALGYAEPNVTRAVIDAAAHGNVSALSSVREIEVAERLTGVIPCAEMVQFLKSGAEAIAAGVHIARTYTNRDLVLGCGYFGWLDWGGDSAGIPAGTREAFRRIPYDDIPALERAVADAGNRLAAIVIEPVIERHPSVEWLQRARDLCDAAGAALIFDEIKTGFRVRTGGYQAYCGVTPDLAAFGKAMANGYPLSAIVGSRELMSAARRTWISSTLASESTALAAASAVLDWHESGEICESLWQAGAAMRASVTAAIAASGVKGVTVDGIDPMWLIRFDDPSRERRFLQIAASRGVLFKRGAYNYPAIAHDEDTIGEIETKTSDTLVQLRDTERAE